MPVNFGILQQPQAPQNNTQVVQTAPQQGGSFGSELSTAINGLLGSTFGKNPVSQANQAVSTSMSNSPLHAIASAILPQGMVGQGRPQGAPGGLLNGFKQALNSDSQGMSLEQLKQNRDALPKMNRSMGDVQAASLAAYDGQSPFQVAQSFLGTGEKQQTQVIENFLTKSGAGKVSIQNTPWCAGFANAVLKSTGHGSTGSLAARSFLNYGAPTSKPSQGDVVVFSDLTRANSPAHGHVGFYAGPGDKDGYIKVLGGNQGGSVSIKEYPASKVLGYRVPPTAEELQQDQLRRQQQQQSNTTDRPY